jgi:RNA-directed DNA polymerase
VLSEIWEPTFSSGSYGFRPGRQASEAVIQAKRYQEEGYKIVVDIDLEKFFDEVNHRRLMSRIMEKTRGEREVHRLIHRYLQSGIMEGGIVTVREKGTPQGSPLSALLSNIVLDELDKELEKRGHRFVRYADDCNIYVKTQRSGERVYDSIKGYVERKMRLKVNEKKSKVDKPSRRKFLGFSFYTKKEGIGIRISAQSVTRFRQQVKRLCQSGRGKRLEYFIRYDLNPYIAGWITYYRLADMKKVSLALDEWIRHRLRNILWRQWKRNWTRRGKLMAAGLEEERAVRSAFNRRGPWWNSGAPHMNQAFPKAYFKELGLVSLLDKYLSYRKSVPNETAVYGTVRTVV